MGLFTTKTSLLIPAAILFVFVAVVHFRLPSVSQLKQIAYHDLLDPPARRANIDSTLPGTDSAESLRNYKEESTNLKQKFEDLKLENRVKTPDEIKRLLESNTIRFHERRVNCSAIIDGDEEETKRAVHLAHDVLRPQNRTEYYDRIDRYRAHYLKETSNCAEFINDQGFITTSLTEEEENFPIAFSILTFKEVDLFVRLMAAVYRPQNFYCIHVDLKSAPDYHTIVNNVADCFPNVFMAGVSHDIRWGNWTIVQAEISCMEKLYKYTSWRYFINLTGQEFPLKTNFELVRILKAYKGANDVDAGVKRRRFFRWDMSPIPPGVTPFQGSTHIAVNRDFVHFVLFNKTSKLLQKWLRPTRVPDETFFATLNHNPQFMIRGSYKGMLRDVEQEYGTKPTFTRYKMWIDQLGICALRHGWKRGVCILSCGDLPRMTKRPYMFANKFMLDRDPLVVGCLEEWMANKTRNFYLGKSEINTKVYEQSTIVKDQIL